jgi:arginyl-tRNA synthetase
MKLLRCTTPSQFTMELPIDRYSQAVYDLLANGTNKEVILVKDDGSYTYTLVSS